VTRTFERTTGFEPATLTLARRRICSAETAHSVEQPLPRPFVRPVRRICSRETSDRRARRSVAADGDRFAARPAASCRAAGRRDHERHVGPYPSTDRRQHQQCHVGSSPQRLSAAQPRRYGIPVAKLQARVRVTIARRCARFEVSLSLARLGSLSA